MSVTAIDPGTAEYVTVTPVGSTFIGHMDAACRAAKGAAAAVPADPYDAWPCPACTTVFNDDRRPAVSEQETTTVVDRVAAAGARGAVFTAATPKQAGMLRLLLAERTHDLDTVRILADLEAGVLPKADASALITTLMAAPRAGVATGRWVRGDDGWLVRFPQGANPGDVVKVRKADGNEVEARLLTAVRHDAGDTLWSVEKADATPAPKGAAALPDVPQGHYAIPSSGANDLMFVRVDRPTDGRWAGRTFVKMVVGGKPEQPVERNRVPGILARIVAAGVAESATLYGQQIGRCWMCNRTLTDEQSRREGIGPDCKLRA
jgi:hypothetical protein